MLNDLQSFCASTGYIRYRLFNSALVMQRAHTHCWAKRTRVPENSTKSNFTPESFRHFVFSFYFMLLIYCDICLLGKSHQAAAHVLLEFIILCYQGKMLAAMSASKDNLWADSEMTWGKIPKKTWQNLYPVRYLMTCCDSGGHPYKTGCGRREKKKKKTHTRPTSSKLHHRLCSVAFVWLLWSFAEPHVETASLRWAGQSIRSGPGHVHLENVCPARLRALA